MKLKINHIRATRIAALLCVAVLISSPIYAENIRGKNAGSLQSDGPRVLFHPEELVVIDIDSIPGFQEGMEIRLEIPPALRRYQNSFALLIFKDISPAPSPDNRSYTGNRSYMRLLPSRDSTFVRIPFSDGHGISGDALTDVLPVFVEADQFPLLLTILPVMKGIPDSAFTEELSVSAVPLWKNEGFLTIGIANPSGNPDEAITVMLDGNEIELDEGLTLSSGIHRVRITSSHAPTVERTVAIEPGQELSLNLVLDYRPPELTVNVPEGSTILLDGEEIDTSGDVMILETTPGSHIITYSLGNLEVNRSFTIRPGAKVKIDLVIEIDIVEYGERAGSEYGAGDG